MYNHMFKVWVECIWAKQVVWLFMPGTSYSESLTSKQLSIPHVLTFLNLLSITLIRIFYKIYVDGLDGLHI